MKIEYLIKDFRCTNNKYLKRYLSKIKFRIIDEYPNYIFYPNGTIFNIQKGDYCSFSKAKNGYYKINLLSKENKNVPWLVHRLMYYVFKGDLIDGCEIHHIDGDESNNSVFNLEQLTKDEHIEKHRIKPRER